MDGRGGGLQGVKGWTELTLSGESYDRFESRCCQGAVGGDIFEAQRWIRTVREGELRSRYYVPNHSDVRDRSLVY